MDEGQHEWNDEWYVRMTIENTPKHPITILFGQWWRDSDDLLDMVILDGVVACQLDNIVSQDTLTPVDHVRNLILAKFVGGLFRSKHLENVPTAPVRVL